MAITAKVRRWGNSLGIVLPKEVVFSQNLEEDNTILVDIVKQADISKLFGTLKKKQR